MQPACVGYWVCPCRPRPHHTTSSVPWELAAKMGSLALWLPAGFGQWKVLAPEQRKSILSAAAPSPTILPNITCPRALHHPFSGPCPSHTLSIVIFVKFSPVTSICFLRQVRNSIQSQLGQRRGLCRKECGISKGYFCGFFFGFSHHPSLWTFYIASLSAFAVHLKYWV